MATNFNNLYSSTVHEITGTLTSAFRYLQSSYSETGEGGDYVDVCGH